MRNTIFCHETFSVTPTKASGTQNNKLTYNICFPRFLPYPSKLGCHNHKILARVLDWPVQSITTLCNNNATFIFNCVNLSYSCCSEDPLLFFFSSLSTSYFKNLDFIYCITQTKCTNTLAHCSWPKECQWNFGKESHTEPVETIPLAKWFSRSLIKKK